MPEPEVLDAGPELDALVAEKVLGWTKRVAKKPDGIPSQHWNKKYHSDWVNGDEDYMYSIYDHCPEEGDYGFSPSTLIQHAWEVVEHFLPFQKTHFREKFLPFAGELTPFMGGNLMLDTAPNVALKICLAALKAVEDNDETS